MASNSLFEQYTSPGKTVGKAALTNERAAIGSLDADEVAMGMHAPTRASELRALGVRLNCYLNTEGVGVVVIGGPKGHGTIVQLPVECDTLEEVMIHVQLRLKLDERMQYASDLWLPDGTEVKSYDQLVEAARVEAPIIVGCGEPFDASRVPLDLLEFHKQGGGRKGPSSVFSGIRESRKRDKMERAEAVREAGHGLLPNSMAVVTARAQNVETNREKAALMRQYYMESLVRRAEMQEDLKMCANNNIKFHRMEKEESRLRYEEKMAGRMERLKLEKSMDERDVDASKREDDAKKKMLHDKVKNSHASHKQKKKEYSERYRAAARS